VSENFSEVLSLFAFSFSILALIGTFVLRKRVDQRFARHHRMLKQLHLLAGSAYNRSKDVEALVEYLAAREKLDAEQEAEDGSTVKEDADSDGSELPIQSEPESEAGPRLRKTYS